MIKARVTILLYSSISILPALVTVALGTEKSSYQQQIEINAP